MRRLRIWLALSVVLSAAAIAVVLGMNLASGLIAGFERSATGLAPILVGARLAAGLATIGMLLGMIIIAAGSALRPGGWGRKVLYVIPAFLVGLTLVGAAMIAAGVGLTGSIGLGPVALPLSGLWTALAGLGAVVATAAAAAMVDIERPFASSAIRIVGATAILTLVAAVTIGTAARMISTSPPSFRAEGRGGQSSGGFTPDVQPFGQGRSGFPEGRARPGAVFANLGRLLPIGGIVGAALSLAGLGVSLAAVRGLRRAGEASIVPSDARARTTRVEVGRAALALCAVGAAALLLIQFVPVARTNPPVLTTVAWDSAETKDLFYRACADCHSNETIWPWYASVAPASWLTAIDVNSARRQFNISDLSARNAFGGFVNVNEIQQRIEDGSMPPIDYLLLHPAARLSDAEKQQLVHGLENSLR